MANGRRILHLIARVLVAVVVVASVVADQDVKNRVARVVDSVHVTICVRHAEMKKQESV
jgi:hypothetical protein